MIAVLVLGGSSAGISAGKGDCPSRLQAALEASAEVVYPGGGEGLHSLLAHKGYAYASNLLGSGPGSASPRLSKLKGRELYRAEYFLAAGTSVTLMLDSSARLVAYRKRVRGKETVQCMGSL